MLSKSWSECLKIAFKNSLCSSSLCETWIATVYCRVWSQFRISQGQSWESRDSWLVCIYLYWRDRNRSFIHKVLYWIILLCISYWMSLSLCSYSLTVGIPRILNPAAVSTTALQEIVQYQHPDIPLLILFPIITPFIISAICKNPTFEHCTI